MAETDVDDSMLERKEREMLGTVESQYRRAAKDYGRPLRRVDFGRYGISCESDADTEKPARDALQWAQEKYQAYTWWMTKCLNRGFCTICIRFTERSAERPGSNETARALATAADAKRTGGRVRCNRHTAILAFYTLLLSLFFVAMVFLIDITWTMRA
jgi:hypothetical protein